MIPKNWLEIVQDLRQVSAIRLAFGIDINETNSYRAQSGSRKVTRSLGNFCLQQEPSPPPEEGEENSAHKGPLRHGILRGNLPLLMVIQWIYIVIQIRWNKPELWALYPLKILHVNWMLWRHLFIILPPPPNLRNISSKVTVSYLFFIASDEVRLQIYLENSDFNCD